MRKNTKQSIILIAVFMTSVFAIVLQLGGIDLFGASLGLILPGFNSDKGAQIVSPEFESFQGLSEFTENSNFNVYFDRELQAEVLAESYPLIDGGLDSRTKSSSGMLGGTYFDFESGVSSSEWFQTADMFWDAYNRSDDTLSKISRTLVTSISKDVITKDTSLNDTVKKEASQITNVEGKTKGHPYYMYLQEGAFGASLYNDYTFDSVDEYTANSFLNYGGDYVNSDTYYQRGQNYFRESELYDSYVFVVNSVEGNLYRVIVDQSGYDLHFTYDYIFKYSVDGDNDFAFKAELYGWPGSGTNNDPYLITNNSLELDGLGAINIQNTQAHFRIEDNSFSSVSHDTEGIVLGNLGNGTVAANDISGFVHGVLVENSQSLIIKHNSISQNSLQGVLVDSSFNVLSYNDNLTSNGGSGLMFHSSYDVVAEKTKPSSNGLLGVEYGTYISAGVGFVYSSGTAKDLSSQSNQGNGVLVFGSDGVEVSASTISSNTANGVMVVSSENVQILDNEISSNGENGVLLSSTAYSLIEGNSVTWNGEDGVSFINSSFNKVLYNDLSNNSNVVLQAQKTDGLVRTLRHGLFLDPSYKNEIAYNNITENGFGIKLEDSDENNIHHNFVSSNAQDGLFVENSDDNVIDSNVFSANSKPSVQAFFLAHMKPGTFTATLRHGLFLDPSSGNTVTNNVVENNYGNGIYVQLSDGNTIDGNTVSGNALDGIFVEDSHYNNITNNDFSYNSNPVLQTEFMLVLKPEGMTRTLRHGLFLDPSTNNLVQGNNFQNEYGTGIGVLGSSNNEIDGNTVTNSGGDGVSVIDSDANKITNNEITGSSNPEMLSAFLSYGKPDGFTATLRHGLFLDPSTGNTVSGNTISNNYGGGLMVESSDGNTFDDNTFSGNGYDGAAFVNSSFNEFTNNKLNANSDPVRQMALNSLLNQYKPNGFAATLRHGLFLDPSNNNTITGNSITNTPGYGIWLQLSDNNVIDDNFVSRNGLDGVFVEDSDQNTISNNDISYNGDDTVLSAFLYHGKPDGYSATLRHGLFLDPSFGNLFKGNNFFNNSGYGVYSLESENNDFIENNFGYNHHFGFLLERSKSFTVYKNSFTFNGDFGLNFDGVSSDSTVTENDFVGNDGEDSQIRDDGGNFFENNFFLDASPFRSYFIFGTAKSVDDSPSSNPSSDLSSLNLDPINVDVRIKHWWWWKHWYKNPVINVDSCVRFMKATIYLPEGFTNYYVNHSSIYVEWNGHQYPAKYVKNVGEDKVWIWFSRNDLSNDVRSEYGYHWDKKSITLNFFGKFGNFLEFMGSQDIYIWTHPDTKRHGHVDVEYTNWHGDTCTKMVYEKHHRHSIYDDPDDDDDPDDNSYHQTKSWWKKRR